MTKDRSEQDQIPAVLPFQTARVIFALVMREMDTAHGRSPGGYLWMILEPIAGIALMSYIFGVFLRTPPLGPSFPLCYATGLLPFGLYSDLMRLCCANRLTAGLPLIPDRLIPRPL